MKRPPAGCLLHERRNGHFVLQVTGHPSYGSRWGRDRLVPTFLAIIAVRRQSPRVTFESAAEMLDTFGLHQGGSQYRRLVGSFQRVFGATIFFGTDTQRVRLRLVHHVRFNLMAEARIWYSRDPEQQFLPGECQNMIALNDEFYRDLHSPNSNRSGSSKGALEQPGGARPLHLAFVSLLYCTWTRTSSTVR
jgi:hypothetical protein